MSDLVRSAQVPGRHADRRKNRSCEEQKGPKTVKPTRFQVVIGVVGMAALLSAFTGGTLAIFTDTKTITNNQFTNTSVSLTTSPTTALVSYSNMLPGDSTTTAAVVESPGSMFE